MARVIRVLLGDGDDQAQVRLDELALRAMGPHRRLPAPSQRRADLDVGHVCLGLDASDTPVDLLQLLERLGDPGGVAAEALQGLAAGSATAGGKERQLLEVAGVDAEGSNHAAALASERPQIPVEGTQALADLLDAPGSQPRLAQPFDDLVEALLDLGPQALPGGLPRAGVGEGALPLRDLAQGGVPLGDDIEEDLGAPLRRAFVFVGEIQGLSELDLALAQRIAESEHLLQAVGRPEHRAHLLVLARLDALRDGDLALAREQGDLAHLA
jgi:hypothetical protein